MSTVNEYTTRINGNRLRLLNNKTIVAPCASLNTNRRQQDVYTSLQMGISRHIQTTHFWPGQPKLTDSPSTPLHIWILQVKQVCCWWLDWGGKLPTSSGGVIWAHHFVRVILDKLLSNLYRTKIQCVVLYMYSHYSYMYTWVVNCDGLFY